ncbi:NAD(P)-dependent alcohol dehydrogenase [Pantanalinema rosaneae CENA516]|uniref:NAD(P)-dependent alcohol dehydrogenase n=1 Tax=Pantanalinema rosaneae TaxID=1620701 RepID=UPI003D6E64FD
MKAAIINRYGDVDVLQYSDVDRPVIKPDQMLVKVYASSINPIDWKIRQGRLKLLTGRNFPFVLGFDLAGDVVEVGDRITRFQIGDAVYARLDQLIGGAYAEYALVSEQAVALKPTTMNYVEAAAVPLAAMTALQGLRDEGGLASGQHVLINGASGGVGTYAVQLAKILGASAVVGVCSANNADLVKRLGADRVIDYQQQDFTQEATRYDIVFDVVGNRAFKDCKRVLQPQGAYVTTQPYPANYVQRLLSWFVPGQKYKVVLLKTNANDLIFLKEQIEVGKLRSVVDRTYPLAEIAAAHAYSETKRAVGKIVITVAQN